MNKKQNITEQISYAVQLNDPMRAELIDEILNALPDNAVKENVLLVKERIKKAGLPVKGFSSAEVAHYQSMFAKEFYFVLHVPDLTSYLEDKIRELRFFISAEPDAEQKTEAELYKTFLQNIILRFAVKRLRLTNEVKAGFCKIMRDHDIIRQGEKEGNKEYCKRICDKFSLEYSDKVRQGINDKITKDCVDKIVKLILPAIEPETKQKIQEYLIKEGLIKQKLYG